MKKLFILLSFLLIQLLSIAQKDITSLVNPFIGTGGHGHTYPGASMPFGMMQLSPDTRMADWDGSSGYHYSDSVIYGFSHTHLSGTGIPDYCDILFMPFTGKVSWDQKDYRSPFSHANEKASPGYYEVLLDKHKIKARLTTSLRSGMHQYQFPTGTKNASVLIDLKHRDEVLESWIEQVSPTEIRGMRRSKSWASDQYVYFHAKFERPIKEFVVLQEGKENNGKNLSLSKRRFSGKDIKAYVNFDLAGKTTQQVKIGISAVSAEGAKKNLDTEIRDWNFNALYQEAKRSWNRELSRIEVKGGSRDQQTSFYTALYHCFLAPNVFQDVDKNYRGTDLKIHQAKGFTNYSVFSLWDTYRAYHPLMTILQKERTVDWIQTFLAQHRNGGMLPVWELAGNETFCMIGYHSVPVILDAYQKGLIKGSEKELLEAMVTYANSDRFGLDHYRANGFLSNEKEHESVSKTLEYAYDDWCIAEFARLTGNEAVYKEFIQRAQYYKNVYDPSSKHMRGKVGARWYTPFDATEINNFYTEANSWQYSFAVPHDIDNLVRLHGGKEKFAQKLNELFTTSSVTTGREQADVTGLIGQYAHGNEPSHHMAYLFNYVGLPWRTQELVNKINKEFYPNTPDGLIGNEDCGQMSAWFVFSAMGFYPVCPGDGQYIIGTPLFDEVIIHLENGKKFSVKANRPDSAAIYVSSLSLNGKDHPQSFIDHKDLANGGQLVFQLSNSKTGWATLEENLPVTRITAEQVTAVPFFNTASNKFRERMMVDLASIDSGAALYYRFKTDGSPKNFLRYEKPFAINTSSTIEAYADLKGNRSHVVDQYFHLVPNNYSVDVISEVHPMYTAGGNDMLTDGLLGTINWRAGDWQSYYDKDFEAVVDLKTSKDITFLGVHVLQDVSPWIVYPKEVIFWVSEDGKNFVEAGKVTNHSDLKMETKGTKEMGINLVSKARYIKIRAMSGGKLPEWHESAGFGTHLFIDEIIIR
jgi:predicted alpha-1,2-mannosidase